MKRVIFACVHNAGRSQMAAAFFNAAADPDKATGVSAGTRPADKVHPGVVDAMQEVGIDLRNAAPQRLTTELAAGASHLITMGCGEECPYLPGLQIQDWPLPDPKGQPVEKVREVREEIRRRVTGFVAQQGWGKTA